MEIEVREHTYQDQSMYWSQFFCGQEEVSLILYQVYCTRPCLVGMSHSRYTRRHWLNIHWLFVIIINCGNACHCHWQQRCQAYLLFRCMNISYCSRITSCISHSIVFVFALLSRVAVLYHIELNYINQSNPSKLAKQQVASCYHRHCINGQVNLFSYPVQSGAPDIHMTSIHIAFNISL